MKQSLQQQIHQLTNRLRQSNGADLAIDEQAILTEQEHEKSLYNNLAIKIITAIGSVFACLFFLSFLFVGGLWENQSVIMTLGFILVVIGIALSIKDVPFFLTSLAVTLIIAGHVLIAIGYFIEFDQPGALYLIFCLIAIAITICTNRGILHFLSMATFIVCLFLSIRDMTPLYAHWSILLLLFSLLLFTMKEAALINSSSWWRERYRPFQVALFAGYLLAHFIPDIIFRTHSYSLMGRSGFEEMPTRSYWQQILLQAYSWANSIGILILVNYILKKLNAQNTIYLLINVAILAILILCWNADLITGMLFLLLLSIHFGYKVSTWVSIVAFAYSIIVFYYDLNINLLSKSIIMMSSGTIMILCWYFFSKKQNPQYVNKN